MIKESSSGSIRTLILSNEKLSVKILAGKGGDINQITYLPEQAELLHTEDENFARYDSRDLRTNPLSRYSEDSTGGWQDVVPGYGRYGSLVFRNFLWEQLRHCPGIIRPRQLPAEIPGRKRK